jgi:hypothetical protein
MNREVEAYKGELQYLRERVKELEMELSWQNHKSDRQTWDEKTVEQDRFF